MEYQRCEKLFKNDYEKIIDKTVLIIGLGGVGGSVVNSLARTGIKNFIIVDNDEVDITNINRQDIATYETVGMRKVDACEQRILSVNKNANIIKYDMKVDKDNIHILFENHIDFVVDACDDRWAKQTIILKCVRTKTKFITSLGMGNKIDPTKIVITKLKNTSYDGLGKKLRVWAKKENIIKKIWTVSSTEKRLSLDTPPGTVSYVPNVAGMFISSFVVKKFIENKINIDEEENE